ncbi:MAG: hypothetical protein EBY65_08055 [Acidimicrobiia bacterium]|nr:hypothetical protein [Acidimicrobiia bacterium]
MLALHDIDVIDEIMKTPNIDAAIGIDQDPQNPAIEFDVVEFGANISHDGGHQLTDSIDNSHGTPLSWSSGRKRRRN